MEEHMLALMLFVVATPPVDASKLTVSKPTAIVEVDTNKLKGDLFRIAWAPDGQQMYLQTVERDRAGHVVTIHHYMMTLDGRAPTHADQEPPWAADYWSWKSAQAAPGVPSMRIEVEQQQKRVTGTATPMGGELARGGLEGGGAMDPVGSGAAAGAMSAAMQSQVAHYYTLRLKSEVVGEFVNVPAVPGLTFGWAPTGTGLIAYGNQEGRLVIMDVHGRKQQVQDTRSVLLPAWTPDGMRLAYFERTGKRKATLEIVEVKQPAP
jgi:hypothetical protein